MMWQLAFADSHLLGWRPLPKNTLIQFCHAPLAAKIGQTQLEGLALKRQP